MFKVIVAAVDESPVSAEVVRTAEVLAAHFDGRVHLFHFVHQDLEYPAAAPMPDDGLGRYLTDKARSDLEVLAGSDTRVDIEDPLLTTKLPWRAITDEVARLRADLLVIGSHRYQGWDRVLRSTTVSVIDHASCHVLVVRPPSDSG